MSEYLDSADVELGDVSSVGTGDSGGDSVVRRMNFTIRNDRIYTEVWNSEIGRDSTTILGTGNTVIGDESDGAEKFLEFLFNTTTTLKGETYQPRDKVSSINRFNGSYAPLLWPTREVVLRIAIQEDSNSPNGSYNQEKGTTQKTNEPMGICDGTTTTYTTNEYPIFLNSETVYLDDVETNDYAINYGTGEISTNLVGKISITYTYYHTLFAGYMGDNISSQGYSISCSCRDYAKRLQDAYIYPEEMRTYDSSVAIEAEALIQNILDDKLGAGTIDLYCPNSPGWMVYPQTELWKYRTTFDATQEIVSQFGWYLGFKWDRYTQKFRYTLMEPPRSKDKYSKDYTLTARNDLYAMDLDINDRDIRNSIKVSYIDSATGTKEDITVEDTDSINEYWRKPMQVGLDNTSLIDTAVEVNIFANSALADLKDLTGTSQINVPIFPQLDLYSGVNFDNPLVSSTVDFSGIESIRHRIQVKKNNSKFRTEATCSGKVVGAHTKWLAMQTRPGAGKPINENEIPGLDLPAVTNITLEDSGIEKLALTSTAYAVLSWIRPTGYYPRYYIIQVQKAGGSWTDIQEFISRESRIKLVLSVGQDYEARIAGLTKTSKPGTWSSTFSISAITSDVSPDPPTINNIIPMVRGLIVNLAENTEDDWDGFEIYVDTTSGFTPASGNLKDKGRKQRFEITDLTPGIRYYVKAIAYDTSGNSSVASNQSDDVAGSETTSSTVVVAASDSSIRGKAGADYVCDGTSDETEINNAVNNLSSVGGKVLLLEGTYTIDGPINLKSNVDLEGQGKSTTIDLLTGFSNNIKMISITGNVQDINIKNLKISGEGKNIGQDGIYLTTATGEVKDINLKNVEVKDVYQGITYGGNTVGGLVTNIKTENCTAGIITTDDLIVNSSKFQNCNVGVYISGSNNLFSGNIIQYNSSWGVHIQKGSAENNITENNIIGNYILLTGDSVDISSNNSLKGNVVREGTSQQSVGIYLNSQYAENTLISNNDLYSSGVDGAIRDEGTSTSFGAGNRVNNGSWLVGADY